MTDLLCPEDVEGAMLHAGDESGASFLADPISQYGKKKKSRDDRFVADRTGPVHARRKR